MSENMIQIIIVTSDNLENNEKIYSEFQNNYKQINTDLKWLKNGKTV